MKPCPVHYKNITKHFNIANKSTRYKVNANFSVTWFLIYATILNQKFKSYKIMAVEHTCKTQILIIFNVMVC